jgi:hypothetical protein
VDVVVSGPHSSLTLSELIVSARLIPGILGNDEAIPPQFVAAQGLKDRRIVAARSENESEPM